MTLSRLRKKKFFFSFSKDTSTPSPEEKSEIADLSLQIGLPSTLIRHEKGAFRNFSLNRTNLKN